MSCLPDIPAEAWERKGFIPDKSTQDYIPDSLTGVGVARKDPVLGEVLGLEEDLLKDGKTRLTYFNLLHYPTLMIYLSSSWISGQNVCQREEASPHPITSEKGSVLSLIWEPLYILGL